MPRDPGNNRTQPAPEHPSGLRPADDAPVFVAPPLDVNTARTPEPVAPQAAEVPFALPLPVEERKSAFPPADPAPVSLAPETVDWDRISARHPVVDEQPPRTVPYVSREPATTIDTSADEEERDALLHDLAALSGLDERPDRDVERTVAQRPTLARARALRFRLALIDAWSTAPIGRSDASESRALHLDMAIEAMLLVALSDGASGSRGLPVVAVMVDALRGIRPDLPRAALRDRGAAAIARLTIIGFRGAVEQLQKSAVAVPPESRLLTLDLAARAALAPAINEHRLGALQDLERALALPSGSLAQSLEAARRRVARAR